MPTHLRFKQFEIVAALYGESLSNPRLFWLGRPDVIVKRGIKVAMEMWDMEVGNLDGQWDTTLEDDIKKVCINLFNVVDGKYKRLEKGDPENPNLDRLTDAELDELEGRFGHKEGQPNPFFLPGAPTIESLGLPEWIKSPLDPDDVLGEAPDDDADDEVKVAWAKASLEHFYTDPDVEAAVKPAVDILLAILKKEKARADKCKDVVVEMAKGIIDVNELHKRKKAKKAEAQRLREEAKAAFEAAELAMEKVEALEKTCGYLSD